MSNATPTTPTTSAAVPQATTDRIARLGMRAEVRNNLLLLESLKQQLEAVCPDMPEHDPTAAREAAVLAARTQAAAERLADAARRLRRSLTK